MMSPTERYLKDPTFHNLVETLRAQIHLANYTPTELREAVILAATLEETYRTRPTAVRP